VEIPLECPTFDIFVIKFLGYCKKVAATKVFEI
jgi:hypothetical protein